MMSKASSVFSGFVEVLYGFGCGIGQSAEPPPTRIDVGIVDFGLSGVVFLVCFGCSLGLVHSVQGWL